MDKTRLNNSIQVWFYKVDCQRTQEKDVLDIPTSWLSVDFNIRLDTKERARKDTPHKDQAATVTSSLGLQSSALFYSSLRAEGSECCHLEISRGIGFDSSADNTEGLMAVAVHAEDSTTWEKQLPKGHVLSGSRSPSVWEEGMQGGNAWQKESLQLHNSYGREDVNSCDGKVGCEEVEGESRDHMNKRWVPTVSCGAPGAWA